MRHHLPDRIHTERLGLRAPEPADARSIFQAYTQDPEVCRFMIWTPHTSEQATREFIDSCIEAWNGDNRRPYVITRSGSNVAIGMIEARLSATAADIGYVLAKPHWEQGFVPEAVIALTNAALANQSLYRVQATCDTENIPSQRTLEKSGFKREGRLERYTIHPNLSLQPRACFMYARVK